VTTNTCVIRNINIKLSHQTIADDETQENIKDQIYQFRMLLSNGVLTQNASYFRQRWLRLSREGRRPC
jgi:hypothetical protein